MIKWNSESPINWEKWWGGIITLCCGGGRGWRGDKGDRDCHLDRKNYVDGEDESGRKRLSSGGSSCGGGSGR